MAGMASGRAGGVLNRIEFPVLLAGVLVAGGLWGFVEMLELARSAGPHTFDTQILRALREAGQPDRPIGPHWLPGVMRDVTALGSASILTMATAAAAFYFLLTRRAAIGLFVIACVAGGQVMAMLLKLGIDRQRPDVVTHLVQESSLSFPSGHATMSAITYLTLAALAASFLHTSAARVYVLSLAVLTTLLVGVSRLYLGVHWPSDVIAGWCVGFAWAMLCWLALRLLRRRGAGRTNP
jgi:undecaprenyl-diphosphatase